MADVCNENKYLDQQTYVIFLEHLLLDTSPLIFIKAPILFVGSRYDLYVSQILHCNQYPLLNELEFRRSTWPTPLPLSALPSTQPFPSVQPCGSLQSSIITCKLSNLGNLSAIIFLEIHPWPVHIVLQQGIILSGRHQFSNVLIENQALKPSTLPSSPCLSLHLVKSFPDATSGPDARHLQQGMNDYISSHWVTTKTESGLANGHYSKLWG